MSGPQTLAAQGREPEIQMVLSRQQSAIDHLAQMVAELTDRLKPIIREEPHEASDKAPDRAFSTQLARRVMEQVRGIDEIAERVIYLNQHIEL